MIADLRAQHQQYLNALSQLGQVAVASELMTCLHARDCVAATDSRSNYESQFRSTIDQTGRGYNQFTE